MVGMICFSNTLNEKEYEGQKAEFVLVSEMKSLCNELQDSTEETIVKLSVLSHTNFDNYDNKLDTKELKRHVARLQRIVSYIDGILSEYVNEKIY